MFFLCCLAASIICKNPLINQTTEFNLTFDVEMIDSFLSIWDCNNHREFLRKAKIILENTLKKYIAVDLSKNFEIFEFRLTEISDAIVDPVVKMFLRFKKIVTDAENHTKIFENSITSETLRKVAQAVCLGLKCDLLFQKVTYKRACVEKLGYTSNLTQFLVTQNSKFINFYNLLLVVVHESKDNSGKESMTHTKEKRFVETWMNSLGSMIRSISN